MTPLDRKMTAPDVRSFSYKHVATYKYIQKSHNGRNGLKIELASIAHTLDRTYQDDAERFHYGNLTHTRSRSACFGKATSFSGRRARKLGFFDALPIVWSIIGSRAKNLRNAAFFSIFLGVLGRCGLALSTVRRSRRFICQWYHNNIDSAAEVTSHQRYRPPAKRSSVASMPEEEIEVGPIRTEILIYIYRSLPLPLLRVQLSSLD